MQWLATCALLTVLVNGGGGVTKTSGIEQFWTDDYKIFEQVYGKTSDKDIYGESLPPSIVIGTDHKKESSHKNERYLLNLDHDSDEQDPYDFGDRYNNLLSKQTLKLLSKKKPATSSINFVSYSNFKPISESNDPETYNYLKHLEELNNEDKFSYPPTMGGFKPYMSYLGPKPEETEAYKSIQEILEAHEANKGSSHKDEDEGRDEMKYLTYPKSKKKKPPRVHNEMSMSKPRCTTGRCRKRGAGPYRPRSRPHVRGVKKTVFLV